MPILLVVVGIVFLIVLITVFKVDAFLSFIITGLITGLLLGMPIKDLTASIQHGIGNTLGFLAIILAFGAMLGKMVAASGAARQISLGLISAFGKRRLRLALMVAGFIVGVPLFFGVGFIILIPLVFTVAATARLPIVYVGLPLVAALSVTHGLLPPHPAPVALIGIFSADMGKTLLYGFIVAVPVIWVSGLLFSRTLKKYNPKPLEVFYNPEDEKQTNMPGLAESILVALSPVILLIAASGLQYVVSEDSFAYNVLVFFSDPIVVMLISVLLAVYFLGLKRGKKVTAVMQNLGNSVKDIAPIMLVIGGAGALNQILSDSGVNNYIAQSLANVEISALFLGWIIAAIIRIAIGSATVSAMTSAGIIAPFALQQGIDPNLMVLSIGAGSLILGHVNDSGFWLFKEYFNLSVKDTFKTWSVMETIISVLGLAGVLIINIFI
ncbi:MAG: gluconate:H+ symporter [Draconibacterium sp.]